MALANHRAEHEVATSLRSFLSGRILAWGVCVWRGGYDFALLLLPWCAWGVIWNHMGPPTYGYQHCYFVCSLLSPPFVSPSDPPYDLVARDGVPPAQLGDLEGLDGVLSVLGPVDDLMVVDVVWPHPPVQADVWGEPLVGTHGRVAQDEELLTLVLAGVAEADLLQVDRPRHGRQQGGLRQDSAAAAQVGRVG